MERRARQFQRVARPGRVLLIAAAALVLFGAVAAASGLGSRVLDLLSVSQSDEEVPRPASVVYVSGDRLNRPGNPPLTLSQSLFAPLLGQHVPLAIDSPDGRFLAYHSWRANTPSLRVVDLRTGRDSLLARGAQSIAWRDRVAYVRGTRQAWRKQTPYLGRVVVADRPGSPASVWTPKAAKYRVVAWAGRVLLVEVEACNTPPCQGMPAGGVYALSRAGQMRRLSVSDVAAVSPDGRFVVGRHAPPASDNPSPIVHVDHIRSGRTIATIDLSRAARGRIPSATVAGGLSTATLRGGKIMGVSSFGSVSARVVLSFDGRRVRLDQALRLDKAARADSRYGFFFLNPTFVGSGAGRVVVQLQGELRGGGYFATTLTCDLTRGSCVRGRALPPRRWLAIVTNPSRPLE